MFNKLKKWYWWVMRDKDVSSAFEDDVASLYRPNVAVEKDMIVVSEHNKLWQAYLAYCMKHDILDKEVDACVKLVNKGNDEQHYARAVAYLLANDKKEENENDWN